MTEINLAQLPFSRKNSYLVVSKLAKNYRGFENEEGLYLRTIHNSTITPLIAKISLKKDGNPLDGKTYLDKAALSFEQDANFEICFQNEMLMFFRGKKGVTAELDFLTDNGPYDYIYEVEHKGKVLYMANCFKNNNRYLVWAQEGIFVLDQKWEESSSLYSRLTVSGDKGILFGIMEIETEWNQELPQIDFEKARESTEKDFLSFLEKYPSAGKNYKELLYKAAYLNWSSIVGRDGFLKREAMYMSKNWMTNVWSWDHCFNAMALAYQNPDFAWDTFMIMSDFQDETGRLPDSVSDNHIIWNYCKPPVHGWALRHMMRHMTLSEEQLKEAYTFLSKWTLWWMNYRRNKGLYYYNHGNDSGWDNSTAFSLLPPVATPELQAFMIVQMDVLSDLADKLNNKENRDYWKKESDAHLKFFLENCFKDNLPVVIQCSTGQIVENKSLLPLEILVLGKKLPEEIRKAVISKVSEKDYFTEYGFATESLESPFYRKDGYWRGPVWAPSTMILIDGLQCSGETELAKKAACRFVDMTARSGFAENFDPLSGDGQRDLAYTWTSSVAIVLAKEYL